jgi:hypothetical protein
LKLHGLLLLTLAATPVLSYPMTAPAEPMRSTYMQSAGFRVTASAYMVDKQPSAYWTRDEHLSKGGGALAKGSAQRKVDM